MSAPTRGAVACAALLLASGLLVACSDDDGPVRIASSSLSKADQQACARFLDDLPDTMDGKDSRPVSPHDALGAAWGDPPITLTCGVEEPTDFTDASTCIEVGDVGWYVPDDVLLSDDLKLDVTMTTMNYRPRVQVVVPGEYRPDGFVNTAGAVAKVVASTLELTQRCL